MENKVIEITDLITSDNKLTEDAGDLIIAFEEAIKTYKAQEDELKNAIKVAMEQRGLKTVKYKNLTISYVGEVKDAEKFNSKKFREENEEIYNKYVTFDGFKSAYVKIAIKEVKDDGTMENK